MPETAIALQEIPLVDSVQADVLVADAVTADVVGLPAADAALIHPVDRLRSFGSIALVVGTIGARALQAVEHTLPDAYSAVATSAHHTIDWLTSVGLHHAAIIADHTPTYDAPIETVAFVSTAPAPEITIPSGANWGQVLTEFGLTHDQATAFMQAHGAQLHDRGLAYSSPAGDWRVNMGAPIHDASGTHGVMARGDALWIHDTAVHDGYLAETQPATPGTTDEPLQPHITPSQTSPFLTEPDKGGLPLNIEPATTPTPAETTPNTPANTKESGDGALGEILLSLGFTATALWILSRRNHPAPAHSPFTNDWWRSKLAKFRPQKS